MSKKRETEDKIPSPNMYVRPKPQRKRRTPEPLKATIGDFLKAKEEK